MLLNPDVISRVTWHRNLAKDKQTTSTHCKILPSLMLFDSNFHQMFSAIKRIVECEILLYQLTVINKTSFFHQMKLLACERDQVLFRSGCVPIPRRSVTQETPSSTKKLYCSSFHKNCTNKSRILIIFFSHSLPIHICNLTK